MASRESGEIETEAGGEADEGAGLYVHVPFCSAVCPYCDFAVLTAKAGRRRTFVDLLLAELDVAPAFPFEVDTLYLGGGTPSILDPEDLERLLAGLRAGLRVAPHARLFFEANPEDVTAASLAAWRALGVETLSLGVQSFEAAELAFLGRRHDPARARASVEQALEAGFETVSIDLIFGLPGQALTAFRSSLETAVALGPHHVSCYQLTFHEGTPFGRRLSKGELRELPDGEQAEHFLLARELLGAAGYEGYEVSNYARGPEHRSRHNRKYWRHVPYLGLGPSAHSFDGRRRWWNERTLKAWEAKVLAGKSPIAGRETLSPAELALETVLFAMRTADGLDLQVFEARFGIDLAAENRAYLERSTAEGLLLFESGRLRPTPRGMAVADALAARLSPGV